MGAPVDIEAALVAHLGPLLGVDVATAVPNPRPLRFGRITRAGGSQRDRFLSDVRVIAEWWAPDEVAAFQLARGAYAHLWAAADTILPGDVWVGRVDLTEPVNFPDPDAPDASRYQFIATLTTTLDDLEAPA